jgi:ABC-type branched-subunit amino acid transport system substrate-binding protein
MNGLGYETARQNVYRVLCTLLLLLVTAFGSSSAVAQSRPAVRGVTDTEIKVGTTVPLTGAGANYGPVYLGSARAFLNYANDQGGVNGRKISFIYKDSGYDPAKGLAVTRQMVEEDKIFAMAAVPATIVNDAIYRYMNANKVPNTGIISGGVQFNQPKEYPYIFQYQLSYGIEPEFTWRVVSEKFPGKKIGVLYENDDFGKGLLKVFAEKAGKAIVAQQSYETVDTDINSQMQALKSAGSEVVVEFVLVKYVALAARFVHASGWNVPQIISANAMDPALWTGLTPEEKNGLMGVTSFPLMTDTSSTQLEFFKQMMKKYSPEVPLGGSAMQGFGAAQFFVEMLKKAGRDVTPEGLVKAAETIKGFKDILLLGPASVSSTNHSPIVCVRLTQMKGAEQEYAGPVWCK